MTNTKYLRTGVLLILLVVAVLTKFLYVPSYKGTGEPYDRIEGTFSTQPIVVRPYVYVPPDTSTTHGIDRDLWVPPASNWLGNEKKTALAELEGARPTLLIIPVQGDRNAFDPIERSLMMRLISDRAALDERNVVLPSSPVIQYFGTNRTSYSDSDIEQLVRLTSSKRVLVLHAQHDRNGMWELRASLLDKELASLKEETAWSRLIYSDEEPPSVALGAIIGDIVEFATDNSVREKAKKYKFDADKFTFPDSIDDLVARSRTSPLHAAAYLQLLGALHPRGEWNETRNHLFERSLVKLQRVSPSAPYYRYFKARAYAYLGRRPAAVATLGTPRNVHETALLDFLNGNLPDLRQQTSDKSASALDFMMSRDLYELESTYSRKQEHGAVERLIQAQPRWARFIERAMQDHDTWASSSMAGIKVGLEDLLPTPDVSLRDRVAKMMVTGEILSELELTRLVWRHIDAIKSAAEPNWKSNEIASHNESVNDILDLAVSIAVANHIGKVSDDLFSRDLPAAALRRIGEFEPLFTGHPAITLLKGRAQQALAEKSQGSEKDNLKTASAETSLNGFSWTGTITPDAATVARNYGELLKDSSYEGPRIAEENYLSVYSRRVFEWPRGASWYHFMSYREAAEGAFERCIAYRPTAFQCLKFEIERQQRDAKDPDAVRDELLAANAHRYFGHPLRSEYEVEVSRTTDSLDSEADLLRAQIEAGSTDWAPFKVLGRLLKRRGAYEEAESVWLSYPGFRPGSTVDAVAIGNNANYAGSALYWIGQYELAKPLLEIAASHQTGSAGQMSAAQRIALIDGDLEAAQYWAAERVRRYRSKPGLRDLLQILHIRGQSDLAWSIFDEVQATVQNSQMWSGTLVGHRTNSASLADIAEWINSSEIRKKAVAGDPRRMTVDLAPRYLLLAGTMDRGPDPELVKLVADAHTRPKPIYTHDALMVNDAGEPLAARARVSSYAGLKQHDVLIPSPRDERRAGPKERIENRYTMIASAMTAFNGGDFEEAYKDFNETAYFYLLDDYLPYHVFSAAVLGRTGHLEAALSARESDLESIRKKEKTISSNQGHRFDEELAYAVLSTFKGDHERALMHLTNALNDRPYIGDRSIYPMYEIVDLADRLYEQTGEDSYRRFALELSRRHMVVLPMYAWAYFIVAKHSPSSVERISAAASGLELDPLSYRATSLPDDELAKARKILQGSGAPYLRRSEKPQEETT